jgi:hypothetical protein
VSNGSWSPTPTSFGRQWQHCDASGTGCTNIAGATGQSYGVRSGDVGHRLRALVTARTSSGSTIVASDLSAVVTAAGTTTVVTTTTTTQTTFTANRAPVLGYLSLRMHAGRAYGRFRVCDNRSGGITIVERDTHNRVLSVTHRFHVMLNASCAVYAKSWVLRRAFHTRGRYVSSARAIDAQGRLGLLKSRSLFFR